MAEEVEIVGVAGGPASEATLKALLEAMKKASGSDSSGAKAQQQYNTAQKKGTKITDEFGNEVEDATSAVSSFGSAVSGVIGMIYNGLAGAVSIATDLFTNLVSAFANGQGTLTDFVNLIPIVGGVLSSLTGIFDDTLDTFKSLASTGAAFNNNLTTLRISAATARLSLDSFAAIVSSNAFKLAALGGTVTKGAKGMSGLTEALGSQRNELLNMGLTFEEINESMLDYAYLTRTQGTLEKRNSVQVAAEAADYAKSLSQLSKLTGEDVKTLREKNAASQADIAFQLQLSKINDPKKLAAINKAMLEAQAAGPTAVARLKELIAGFPPLTRETQLLAATMPTAERGLQDLATAALSGTLDEETRKKAVSRIIAGTLVDAKGMQTVITAGVLKGEGIGAEIASIIENLGMATSDILGKTFDEASDIIFARLSDTSKETAERDKVVVGLNSFRDKLLDIKLAFEKHVVLPLSVAIGPSLELLASALAKLDETKISSFGTAISTFVDNLTNDISTMGIKEAFMKWMGDVKVLLMDGIKSTLFGSVSKDEKTGIETKHGGIFSDILPDLGELKEVAGMIGKGGLAFAAFAAFGLLLATFAGTLPVALGLTAIGLFLTGTSFAFTLVADGIKTVADSIDTMANAIIKLSNLKATSMKEIGKSLEPLSDALFSFATGGIMQKFLADDILGKMATSLTTITNLNTAKLNSITSSLGEFKKLSESKFNLDDSKIKSFTESIVDLTDELKNLNLELQADNSNMYGKNKASAGSVLSGIGENAAGLGSKEGIESLNTTMIQVVKLLQKNQTQNADIISGLKKVRGEI